MPRTIHKLPLRRVSQQVVPVRGFIEKLDVQLQRGEIVMWVLVNTDFSEVTPLTVNLQGTGAPIEDGLSYRNYWRTVQDVHEMVWHVFVREGSV